MNRTPLPELVRVLLTLGDFGTRLSPADATPEQLAIVARAIEEARRLVTAAQGPSSGCSLHPDGPTDPTDGGRCLLCRTRRTGATTTTTAPPKTVLADITAHGEEEAARRHGARAVTLALAAAGRGTYRYPPNCRPPQRTHDEELTP